MNSKILICGGLLLIASALAVFVHDGVKAHRAGIASQQVLEELDDLADRPAPLQPGTPPAEGPSSPERQDPQREMPVREIGGNEYVGVLEIPVLELSLPVMSRWSYPLLELAPCRYSGSAYQDNLILLGHNYPAHFGGLKDLAEGDMVSFTDLDGSCFVYTVSQVAQLEAAAVEELEAGDWDLTLFTCTASGIARIAVRCEKTDTAASSG